MNVVVLLFVVLVVVFGPIFTIWALNALFATAIPVTFWTWLSVLWLQSVAVGLKYKTTKE